MSEGMENTEKYVSKITNINTQRLFESLKFKKRHCNEFITYTYNLCTQK